MSSKPTRKCSQRVGVSARQESYRKLLASVRHRTGLSASETRATVEALIAEILARTSAGERVSVRGLGHFFCRPRAARTMRHPGTGDLIETDASHALAFKPLRRLRRLVKNT